MTPTSPSRAAFGSHLVRLAADRWGNAAMTWALAATVLLSLVGLSIDYARALATRSQVQHAADGAALVAEQLASHPLAKRQAAAEQYFRARLAGRPRARLATLRIDVVPGGGHRAVAAMPSPTTLARLVTGRDFRVMAAAVARLPLDPPAGAPNPRLECRVLGGDSGRCWSLSTLPALPDVSVRSSP